MTRSTPAGIRAITIVAVVAALISGCSVTTATPPRAPAGISSELTSKVSELSDFYNQNVDWRNCGDADCTTFEVP